MAISVVGQYPRFRAYDPLTKLPLVGGKLYCYAPNTTTLKAIYTTYARTVQAANPVILDANGEALFYLDGMYDLALFDANNVPVWTVEDYNDQPVSATASVSAPSIEGTTTNPSFEYEGATVGLPSNWTIFKWNTVELDSTAGHSGGKSLKFVSPGGAPGVSGGGTATSDKFFTRPSSIISIGATLKSSAAGVHNQIQLLEYNSADALQATTTIYDDAATNPASFTTFWRTVTLGANTAWVKIYVVGANNDSAVAGTTWVDSIEVRHASVGGTLNFNHLTFSGSVVIDSTGLTVSSATTNVTATGTLTLQGNILAINGTTSSTVTTPVLDINAATSTTITSPTVSIAASTSTTVTTPVLSVSSATSVTITSPSITLSASTAITVVSPLITCVAGLVIGAATGGAKGDGTINAVQLYDNNNRVLVVGGSQALTSTVTLTGFGIVLGTATGGTQGAGTINAQALYDDGEIVLHQGTNALTNTVTITGGFQITTAGPLSVFTDRRCLANVEGGALTQVVANGKVTSAGVITSGQGYSVVKLGGTGGYRLTWTTAFFTLPAVCVTTGFTGTGTIAIASPTTTTCDIQLYDHTGVAADNDFSFVAIGSK